MEQVSENSVRKKSNAAFKKFWVILFSLLVLLIPLGFFVGIVNDREKYRNDAVRDVANSWAAEQKRNFQSSRLYRRCCDERKFH